MLFVLLYQDANIFNKNIQLTLFCAVIMFSKKNNKREEEKEIFGKMFHQINNLLSYNLVYIPVSGAK